MSDSQRVLVTGGTGFTGGHLCERLCRSGASVRAVVRDPSRADLLCKWGVEIVPGDLRDERSLEKAVDGIDIVYHIAATFRAENVTRRQMWEVNVQGTRNMLEAARKARVKRFVHCSTIGVHGDIKNPPADEKAPYGPGDHYQESKVEGETIAFDYSARGLLPIVVFRPGGIYGPRDLRFLKLFRPIMRRRFVMLGSGEVIYQMIYIDDLIDGILLCGTHERAIGKVYILTGDEPVTLNKLVRTIARVLGVPPPKFRIPVMPVYLAGWACELICKPFGINPPLYRRRVDFFRKTRCFDITKARQELGFEPRIDLQAGVSRTAQWFRQEGLL